MSFNGLYQWKPIQQPSSTRPVPACPWALPSYNLRPSKIAWAWSIRIGKWALGLGTLLSSGSAARCAQAGGVYGLCWRPGWMLISPRALPLRPDSFWSSLCPSMRTCSPSAERAAERLEPPLESRKNVGIFQFICFYVLFYVFRIEQQEQQERVYPCKDVSTSAVYNGDGDNGDDDGVD